MDDNRPVVIYRPDGTRKLIGYPDMQRVQEELGHDHSGGTDWNDTDRVIDSKGRLYAIRYSTEDHFYSPVGTGETWDYSRVLELAVAEHRRVRKSHDALVSALGSASDDQKIATIFTCVRDLPDGPPWFIAFQWLFIAGIVIIFAGMVYGAYRIIQWLVH
jgi:hypothetical protein